MTSDLQSSPGTPENELSHKLIWLMFGRVVFTSLLLGSTIVLQLGQNPSPLSMPLLVLYGLIAGVFLLSFLYALILGRSKQGVVFAYFQISVDTFIVTCIIFVTGGFGSIFSFLYLVVIVYSSVLLFRKGSMIMASLSSIQYGIMIDLEYYGILQPFIMEKSFSASNYAGSHVLYKILITMIACFAVALLSGFLSEQVRRTKEELHLLEERVKRVEKLAYMGEMAAGMAHEIKNPLASLAGAIQILKKETVYEPEHNMLMRIVLRETDRLSALVNNFLLFARPPEGKPEKMNLVVVLADTIKLFEKDRTCDNRIEMINESSGDIWIEIDPEHFRQVLWNLLLNAAEAIEKQGVISIKTYPVKPNDAVIEITDSGCGMSKEVMESIFNPFFTTKPHGTGLGLSIVHSILESYGTWLDVKSRVDQGTTFTFRLKRTQLPS